jgi:hypothetical protein
MAPDTREMCESLTKLLGESVVITTTSLQGMVTAFSVGLHGSPLVKVEYVNKEGTGCSGWVDAAAVMAFKSL